MLESPTVLLLVMAIIGLLIVCLVNGMKRDVLRKENNLLKSNVACPVHITEICQVGGTVEILNEAAVGLCGRHAFVHVGNDDQKVRVVCIDNVSFTGDDEADTRFAPHEGKYRLIRREVHGDDSSAPWSYELKEIVILSESISDRGVSGAQELLDLRK